MYSAYPSGRIEIELRFASRHFLRPPDGVANCAKTGLLIVKRVQVAPSPALSPRRRYVCLVAPTAGFHTSLGQRPGNAPGMAKPQEIRAESPLYRSD